MDSPKEYQRPDITGNVEIRKPLLDDVMVNDSRWDRQEKLKWMITFFIGNILLYSARSVMSISIPVISIEFEWNKVVSGLVLSSFFCGYLCTNMIGGHFADKMGGEVVICYAGIGWTFLTTALPFIARLHCKFLSSTYLVIFSRFVTGLSQGVFYPSISAIMAQRIMISERGLFSGFTTSGASIGSAVTGLFGSLIIDRYDWSVAFLIIGSLSILWIIWLRYLISFQRSRTSSMKKSKPKERLPICKLMSTGAFWGLFIAYFCASYCFLVMLSWTPVYFHDSFPAGKGWLFNTVPWFCAFILSNIVGHIGKMIADRGISTNAIRKIFCTLQLLGFSLCSICVYYVTSFKQALFIMSVNIASNAFSNCALSLNAQDLAPEHAGALHGIVNGTGALSGVIGVYLTGYILRQTNNNWSHVFILNSVVSFVGWISFMFLGSANQVI